MTEHAYGETRITGAYIRHAPGRFCGSIPSGNFSFSIASIRLVGELTRAGGPILDYFYVFVAGDPVEIYMIPMESLEEGDALQRFFDELEVRLRGKLHHALSLSTQFATSVMWPEALAGKQLFDELQLPRTGTWGRLLDRIKPRGRLVLTPELQRELQCSPDWANGTIRATRHEPASTEPSLPIVLPIQRKQLLRGFGAAAMLIACGACAWLLPAHFPRYLALIFEVLGVAVMSMGFALSAWLIYRWRDPRPGLVIDAEGIVDRTGGNSLGRIYWHEITGLRTASISGHDFLVIDLRDPEARLAASGKIWRSLQRLNARWTGSIANISPRLLGISCDELAELIVRAQATAIGERRAAD